MSDKIGLSHPLVQIVWGGGRKWEQEKRRLIGDMVYYLLIEWCYDWGVLQTLPTHHQFCHQLHSPHLPDHRPLPLAPWARCIIQTSEAGEGASVAAATGVQPEEDSEDWRIGGEARLLEAPGGGKEAPWHFMIFKASIYLSCSVVLEQ